MKHMDLKVNMRRKGFVHISSLFLVSSLFIVQSVYAGESNKMKPVSMKVQSSNSTNSDLSSSDFKNSIPMPLPQITGDNGTMVDRLKQQATGGDNTPVKSSNFSRPSSSKEPDLENRLFDGEAKNPAPLNVGQNLSKAADSLEDNAVGSSGAYYTSSRINPRSSRTVWPNRTIGRLFFKKGSATFSCSASVISRRVIITAGHCVHSGNGSSTGWFTDWRFVPAYDNGSAPFGTWRASRVVVSGEWYAGGGGVPNSDDYAVLIMRDRGGVPIGSRTGWLGWLTNSLHPNHLTAVGYPGNLDRANIMHFVNAETWKFYSPNNYSIGSDMRGGSSGGPWIQNFGVRAVGQPASGGVKGYTNSVVSVTSWGWVSTGPKEQGGAQLDGTFVNIWNLACQPSSNCQ